MFIEDFYCPILIFKISFNEYRHLLAKMLCELDKIGDGLMLDIGGVQRQGRKRKESRFKKLETGLSSLIVVFLIF